MLGGLLRRIDAHRHEMVGLRAFGAQAKAGSFSVTVDRVGNEDRGRRR